MMKQKTQNIVYGGRKALSLYIAAGLLSLVGFATESSAFSVEEYNQNLIQHGISWSSKSSSTFMPSLYLGFAPKVETANQIHFRLGRGDPNSSNGSNG